MVEGKKEMSEVLITKSINAFIELFHAAFPDVAEADFSFTIRRVGKTTISKIWTTEEEKEEK